MKSRAKDGKNELGAVLSDTQIKSRLKEDLIIHPILNKEAQITCSKVDLHLSGIFYEIQRTTSDSYDPLTAPPQHDYRREIVLPLGACRETWC